MLEPQAPYEALKRSRDLLLLLILAVVALLFSSQHTTTAFSKQTTFYALVWFALIPELILCWRHGWAGVRLWRIPLLCLGGFLVWAAISTYWITPIPRSFRELSRWLALMSLVIVGIGAGRSSWFRRQVLFYATIVPLLISLYACIQSFGYDFFVWPDFQSGKILKRVTGTLGNPDFLAGYLVGTIPLTVAYGILGSKRWQRILSGLSAALQLATLVLSLSRGVWIGVFLAILAALTTLPNRNRILKQIWQFISPPKRRAIALIALVIGLTLLWPAISGLMSRVARGIGPSLAGRWHIYVSSLHLIEESPITGVGLGAFPVRFPEVRSAALSHYLPFGQWYVEHAHSEPLEVFVDLGIIGFLLWLGALCFWSRTLLSRLKPCGRYKAVLAGACWISVIGILGHNLVTVTLRHTASAVLFWALIGVSIGVLSDTEENTTHKTTYSWVAVILIFILIGAPMVWMRGICLHQSDRYFHEAQNVIDQALKTQRSRLREKRCHFSLDILAKADRLAPERKESLYWRAWAYYELEDYIAALREYEKTIRLEGPFVDSVPNAGKSLLRLGAEYYLPMGFKSRAMEAYRKSLYYWDWACRLDPQNPEHWQNKGGPLGMLGRIDEARAALNKAIELQKSPREKQKIRQLLERLNNEAEDLQRQAEQFIDKG